MTDRIEDKQPPKDPEPSNLSSEAQEELQSGNKQNWSPSADSQPGTDSAANKILAGMDLTDDQASKQREPTQIDYFRENLKAAGIDPDKVSSRIVVRELAASPDPNDTMADWHAGTVACSMNDPELGLSRNMNLDVLRDGFEDIPHDPRKQINIQSEIVKNAVQTVSAFTMTLQQQFLNSDNPARVLNASNGGSVVDIAMATFNHMRHEPERFAGLIEQILGKKNGSEWIKKQVANPPQENDQEAPVRLTDEQLQQIKQGKCPDLSNAEANHSSEPPKHQQLMQKLIELTEKTLAGSKEFQKSMDLYRQTAKAIAENGGIIVVAAGNHGDFAERNNVKLQTGSAYNWLAMSDYVISVGASADTGKRGDPKDDSLSPLSSPGTKSYYPTVLALGESFPTRLHPAGSIDGTSYASPLVANAIGLMLEQDPKLGFSRIKEILKQNSHRIAGVPVERQGNGILHIDKAVLSARSRAK